MMQGIPYRCICGCVVIMYTSKLEIFFAILNICPFGRTSGIVNIIQIRNSTIGDTVIQSVNVQAKGIFTGRTKVFAYCETF